MISAEPAFSVHIASVGRPALMKQCASSRKCS